MGPKHAAVALVLFALMQSGLGIMASAPAPAQDAPPYAEEPTPSTGGSPSGGTIDVGQTGGKGDITKALPDVFRKACGTPGGVKILIPKGEYTMGKVTLKGPCKGPITFEVQGNIMAPESPEPLQDSWITFGYIDYLTILGRGAFNGNGRKAWSMNTCQKNSNCPTLPVSIRFNFIKHSIVRDVASIDSKNFHVNLLGCENLTFTNFNVRAPANSPNTDGIHMGRSSDIKIINSIIGTGDDCISIGDGTSNLHVTGVTCGPGHGISVGSLGKYPNEQPVSGIFIRNCTLRNTDNGVRIKTYASDYPVTVDDLLFEDIIVENVTNPIIVDQEYCPTGQCDNSAGSKVKISNVKFNNIKGTSSVKEAVKFACSPTLPCQNIEVGNIDISYKGGDGSATFECANVKPTLIGKQSIQPCSSAPKKKKN